MKHNLLSDKEYKTWLSEIKSKVRNAQLKAAVRVNTELLTFYWELGADIVAKQAKAKWGDGLVDQLSKDLSSEFPDMRGFSRANLMYVKKWYLFYNQGNTIVQQAVGQLNPTGISQQAVGLIGQQLAAKITQIPWGHNIVIITNCKSIKEATFYVQNTIKYNWSRSVLEHQIESGLYEREGKAINNFALTLPKPQSDLAEQTLKDPYWFDFLTLTKKHNERELENALVEHITKFLLELGAGFAYVGRQVPLRVGESDFYIDLLFYHLRLRCYVVVELKKGEFKPEYAGKMNFYCSVVDDQLRHRQDEPTIGLILCQTKDCILAEYSLRDINKPIGIADYELTRALPQELALSLPTIEAIEAELSGDLDQTEES